MYSGSKFWGEQLSENFICVSIYNENVYNVKHVFDTQTQNDTQWYVVNFVITGSYASYETYIISRRQTCIFHCQHNSVTGNPLHSSQQVWNTFCTTLLLNTWVRNISDNVFEFYVLFLVSICLLLFQTSFCMDVKK